MPYKNPNAQCEASKRLEADYDKVYDLYHNQKKSMYELADLYDTNIGVVQYFFGIYEIEARLHTERPLFKTKKTQHVWENRDIVKKMYLDDSISTIELGKHFNVSSDLISKILKEDGVKLRGYTSKKTQKAWEYVDGIIELYINKKWSRVQIGKHYNCSHKTIEHILNANGIPLRKLSDRMTVLNARENADKIQKRYVHNKHEIQDIADEYDVCGSTIKKILIDHGIEIHDAT